MYRFRAMRGPGSRSGRRPAVGLVAVEEVVEANFVEGCGGGVGGDVTAQTQAGTLCPVDHHRRVPTDAGTDPALEFLVAGECGSASGEIVFT